MASEVGEPFTDLGQLCPQQRVAGDVEAQDRRVTPDQLDDAAHAGGSRWPNTPGPWVPDTEVIRTRSVSSLMRSRVSTVVAVPTKVSEAPAPEGSTPVMVGTTTPCRVTRPIRGPSSSGARIRQLRNTH